MTPNLRSVVTQGWRSICSRRNFSSSPGSKQAAKPGGRIVIKPHVVKGLFYRSAATMGGYFLGVFLCNDRQNEILRMEKALEEDLWGQNKVKPDDSVVSARKF